MFNALGIRTYRLYWSYTLVSNFSNQMLMPAQSWLAYQLTDSSLMLTLVMAMQAIPCIIISLFAGVINDRIQKRNMILFTMLIGTAVNLIIAILIATGHIQYWHLLAASFISGVNWGLCIPARYAIVAEIMPRDELYNAVALNNAGANATQIAGPAISGILIALIGSQGAYFVAVGLSIIAIIITSYLPATSKINASARLSLATVNKNLVEGFSYLRTRDFLILVFIMEFIITIFGMSFQGILPVFATQFGQESEGYGFMLAALGIGSLIGSLVIASLGNFKRKWLVLAASGTAMGGLLVLFANSGWVSSILHIDSLVFWIASFWLITNGFCMMAYTNTSNAVIQIFTDEKYRGRVNSVMGLIVGFYPLCGLGVGALADLMGATWSVTIIGAALFLSMLSIALFSRVLRRME